jgi:hypothetical protein
MKTLRDKLDEFPPVVCRLVARKAGRRGGSLSHTELANRSGLERSTVAKLSQQPTWGDCSLVTIEKFSTACGVNLLHTSRQKDFLKRRLKEHIKNGNTKYLIRLLAIIKQSRQPHSARQS